MAEHLREAEPCELAHTYALLCSIPIEPANEFIADAASLLGERRGYFIQDAISREEDDLSSRLELTPCG